MVCMMLSGVALVFIWVGICTIGALKLIMSDFDPFVKSSIFLVSFPLAPPPSP